MEFLVLKLKKILDTLHIDISFRNVLSYNKKETHVTNNYYEIHLLPESELPETVDSGDTSLSRGVLPTIKVELSREQVYLISKVNEVHSGNYDFKDDYSWYIEHRSSKKSEDWMVSAANRLVKCIQDSNFFNYFVTTQEPELASELQGHLNKVSYSYRQIQKIKHTNDDKIASQFETEYHRNMDQRPNFNNETYEKIFDDFEDCLIQLFRFYESINRITS